MGNVSQVASSASQQQQQQQTQQSNQAQQSQQQAQQQANQQQNQSQQQSQQQQQLTTIPGTNIQIPTSVATANGIISGNNIKLDGSGIIENQKVKKRHIHLCFHIP